MIRSLAARVETSASRNTLRKTCADANAGGVFNAARHSGVHSRATIVAG